MRHAWIIALLLMAGVPSIASAGDRWGVGFGYSNRGGSFHHSGSRSGFTFGFGYRYQTRNSSDNLFDFSRNIFFAELRADL